MYPSRLTLGEGWDHVVYDTGDGLIARVRKEPDPEAVRREATLLAALARVATLPVPEVVEADPARGVLVVRKLPGVPLSERPAHDPVRLAAVLGEFLSALHRSGLEAPAVSGTLPGLLRRAGHDYREIATRLPAGARRAVEAFLSAAPPEEAAVAAFCHNDLGDEHVLLEAGEVTGVIDWSDAAVGDPARDFALLYRDLGPEFCELLAAHYAGEYSRERAAFYARCTLLGDIAYGMRTGERRYAEEGLALLDRTMAGAA
ncbi:phosphotransferase family protein [Thermoactinospora rubra]|uniref:phosphotransferase family protein n=1 Tax=Thermoactinospora rubra TaxID=1088767 RepID=UPI0013020586|nr:phosphotransferase [Thermoactinospora rubra]